MTTDARHPSPGLQLELPLATPPAPPSRPGGADWRLDERTRRIGRRGVAAARARLGQPAGAAGGPTATARGGAGRAA